MTKVDIERVMGVCSVDEDTNRRCWIENFGELRASGVHVSLQSRCVGSGITASDSCSAGGQSRVDKVRPGQGHE